MFLFQALRPVWIFTAYYVVFWTLFFSTPSSGLLQAVFPAFLILTVILLILWWTLISIRPRHMLYLASVGAEEGTSWVNYLERHFHLLYSEIRTDVPKQYTELFILSPFLLAEEDESRLKGLSFDTIVAGIIVSEAETEGVYEDSEIHPQQTVIKISKDCQGFTEA